VEAPTPRVNLLPSTRSDAARAFALAIVLFLLHTGTTFAATNWGAIQTAMKANGTVMPGDVLRFELVRQDLTMTINGTAVPAQEVASVANGFVAFKEMSNGQFYADGALPAQESEVTALQDALLKHAHIHITAMVNNLINESPKLVWVHFEASYHGEQLATWLATALDTIHSPQVGVSVVPGVNNIIDPSKILPPKVLKLFDEGFVEQLTDIFAFYLPRPNEHGIVLDNDVTAETGLGVGQSFYIQVPFSGGANVTLNIDFALRVGDLQPVETMLRAGGFTLSSQSNHFINESRHLYFVHATASGDGFSLGNTLYNVIQVIQNNQAAWGNR
jgi:Domain of Unknown Function (DUF1259)